MYQMTLYENILRKNIKASKIINSRLQIKIEADILYKTLLSNINRMCLRGRSLISSLTDMTRLMGT